MDQSRLTSEQWAVGYKKVVVVRKLLGKGIKATEKIVDLTSVSPQKLEKVSLDDLIKSVKKQDLVIDKMDAAISQYFIWRRKFEKALEMPLGAPGLEIRGFWKNIERYIITRGLFNKRLQNLQRVARVA